MPSTTRFFDNSQKSNIILKKERKYSLLGSYVESFHYMDIYLRENNYCI